MGKINVLDINVANLIAAGEVVERPASVVKELLENSIDAGAKNVTVEIKRGGVSLIRVTDDGCGMSYEDLPVCILRHATSKISSKQDLNGITTLGFRGEALAAIASVCRLRIITKQKNGAGYVLESRGGNIAGVTETGCADGTSVIVEELFANVPARRKFLKKDSTEAGAVYTVCERLALSNPDVSLTLISDNSLRFRTSGDGVLKNAIYSVMGREFANNLLAVDSSTDGIDVCGFIGTPSNSRPNRNMQIFFVNGRYVKSKSIQAALEAAVQSYVPHEKFPTAVLNVTLHPGCVDVNVHPTKTEVKFSNERAIFDAVYCSVKASVDASTKRPELEISEIAKAPGVEVRFTPIEDGRPESLKKRQLSFDPYQKESTPALERVPFVKRQTETEAPTSHGLALHAPNYDDVPEEIKHPERILPQKEDVPQKNADVLPNDGENGRDEPSGDCQVTKKVGEYRLCGEIFNTYLIVECENEAYIIDKHAAHERIIFEELKMGVKSKSGYSQILMIPLEIPLSDEEMASAEEFRDEITKTGFSYEIKEGLGIVSEIPSNLTEGAALDLFITVLSELAQGMGNARLARDLLYEKALYQSSCKAAIKAGDINSPQELKCLVDRLMACPQITHCPHGRPVAFIMTKSSIEKRFGRI